MQGDSVRLLVCVSPDIGDMFEDSHSKMLEMKMRSRDTSTLCIIMQLTHRPITVCQGMVWLLLLNIVCFRYVGSRVYITIRIYIFNCSQSNFYSREIERKRGREGTGATIHGYKDVGRNGSRACWRDGGRTILCIYGEEGERAIGEKARDRRTGSRSRCIV